MTIIHGNEPYLIDYEILKIKQQYQETAVYYEWTTELEEALCCPSIFSKKKAVILKLIELQEHMEPLWDAACDVYLIIEKLDKRRKIYKKFSNCHLVTCNKLDIMSFNKFILREFSRCAMNIKEDAFTLFVNRIQYQENDSVNLYMVQNYVRQICFAAQADTMQFVNIDLINAFLAENVSEHIYHLTNALFQKNAQKYMNLTLTFIKDKNGIYLLSGLLRTFRIAYKAALYEELPPKELEKKLKVPAYQYCVVQKLCPNDIQTCMDILIEGIDEIKSGSTDELCLIYTLCQLWHTVVKSMNMH